MPRHRWLGIRQVAEGPSTLSGRPFMACYRAPLRRLALALTLARTAALAFGWALAAIITSHLHLATSSLSFTAPLTRTRTRTTRATMTGGPWPTLPLRPLPLLRVEGRDNGKCCRASRVVTVLFLSAAARIETGVEHEAEGRGPTNRGTRRAIAVWQVYGCCGGVQWMC